MKFLFFLLIVCLELILDMPNVQAKSIGVMSIDFIAPETKLPMVAVLFYPSSGAPSNEKAKSVWVKKNYLLDAPFEEKAKAYPLIILSHGFQGDRTGHTWMAEELVEKGYIVIALDHPRSNSYDFSDEFTYTSLWQRPKDISILLDYVLKEAKYSVHIDQKRIVAGGFSLGGLTTLWLAGARAEAKSYQLAMSSYTRYDVWSPSVLSRIANLNWSEAENSYKDPRIKAIFSIAPDLGTGFKREGINKIDIPTLIIVGDEDQVTPQDKNAKYFADSIDKNLVHFVLIKGATHFAFLNQCSTFGKSVLPSKLCQNRGRAPQNEIYKTTMTEILKFLKLKL